MANVTVYYGERTVPAKLPPADATPPPSGPFELDEILDDQSDGLDEIILLNREELLRLYDWCDFLSERDGTFELFEPLIRALRAGTGGLGEQG